MTNVKNKKSLFIVAIITLTICIVTLFGTILGSVEAEEVKQGEIEIAHITDLHYYSYSSCYHADPNQDGYKDTDYYKDKQTVTQMKYESTSLFAETLQGILREKPDYLLISGDITSNGELKGHYDVANALRWLQNSIRASGKPNFQVLVVPGNHDLYNSRASYYTDNDCTINGIEYKAGDVVKVPENITTAQAFSIIYHGLGYPDLTETEIRSSEDPIIVNMINYYDAQSTNKYAFTTRYHASANASNLTIQYYKDALGAEWYPTRYNRQQGCLTYFVKGDNGFSFACFDSTEREYILEDYPLGKTNTLNNTVSYYEELTGGRISVDTLKWMKNVASNVMNSKDTIIAQAHHNFVPHYALEENYTKDFTVYNWQDTISYLTDELTIRYAFSGHMHAVDRAQYVSYEGNVLQDFETSSIISVGNATRFTKIARYSNGAEDVNSLVVKLQTLQGVKGLKIDDEESDNDTSLYIYNDILNLDNATRIDIFYNIVDKLLGSYLNASLVDTLNGLVESLDLSSIASIVTPINAVKDLAPILIDEIFNDFDYNIDGVEGEDLADYVLKLLDKNEENLNIIVWQEGEDTFTLEQLVLWAYTSHLEGGEGATFDLNTPIGKAADTMIGKMEDGSLVKQLFSDLLDPLLYADNSVLKQLFTHEFNVSSLINNSDAEKRNNFISLVSLFIPKDDATHPLNNGGKLAINSLLRKDAQILNMALPLLNLSSSITDMVNEALDKGVLNWAESFLDKYLTDSFYTNIGGLLAEAISSFAIDEYNDGKIIDYKNTGIVAEDWENTLVLPDIDNYQSIHTYSGEKLTIEQNVPTFADGRLPSIFTSTFGDDTSSSQNFKWYTDYKVEGKLLYRKVGDTEWKEATVNTTKKVVEIPLIDIGLFATKTASEYKPVTVTPTSFDIGKKQEIVYVSDDEFFKDRERHGVKTSVKLASVHEVFLTNLESNTEYEYKVYGVYKDNEYCLQDYVEGWEKDKPYIFKTAIKEGTSNDFSILAISDLQGTISNSYSLAKKALDAATAKFDYDFIINCGDVTDSGSNIKQWSYAQNMLSSILGNTSTVIAAGNHESSHGALASYYNFGNIGNGNSQDTETGVYYSFNYGKTHFIVLNTNDYNKNGLGSKQLRWLNSDLEEANKNANISNIVVAMHKGLYSVGSHVEDTEVVAMKKQLTKVFAENGVDLVLQGHDHVYNTTQVIDKDGKVVKDLSKEKNTYKINNEDGVVYMTLGTIADKYYEYRQVKETEQLLSEDFTIFSQINTPMMTNITFDDNGVITVNTYAYNQETNTLMTVQEYKNYLKGNSTLWIWIVVACVIVVAAVVVISLVIMKNKKGKVELVIETINNEVQSSEENDINSKKENLD